MCTFEEFYSAREKVSILVFVELALDGQLYVPSQVPTLVSILVFVELALDDVYATAGTYPITGFNPCFRGTCS